VTDLTPLEVVIEKERKVAFCGCKQTKNPPFCDGTHKTLP
jgi:CDGSH-type Zn-finger protein